MRIFALLAAVPSAAFAVDIDLEHAGRLLDSAGAPVNGTETLLFTLYDGGGGFLTSRQFDNEPVDDGYYSVTLTALDSLWFAAPVDLGIKVGEEDELPLQRLVSAPRAAHADHANRITVSSSPLSGACDIGEVRYDTTAGRLRVCADGNWDVNIVQTAGVRTWSDGTAAASCDEYRNPANPTHYAGAVGDGVYRITPDGVSLIDVFCDMTVDGGGWTLLFNLESEDGVIHHFEDTDFWLTDSVEGSAGLSAGHKSLAFSKLSGFDEILIRVHRSSNSTTYGYAVRPMLAAFTNSTFEQIMGAGNDQVITGAATLVSGSVPTNHNTDRTQTVSGDAFVDHSHALTANFTSRWNSADAVGRIGTTLTNNISGHTLGGALGGRHQHGIGSYGTKFESAPIGEYCDTRNGYGGTGNYVAFGSNSPYSASCKNGAFAWIPADTALYVR